MGNYLSTSANSGCVAACSQEAFELSEPKTVVMIGAPLSEGQDWETGVDNASREIRTGGLKEVVEDMPGWKFEDWGDLEFAHKGVAPVSERVSDSFAKPDYYDAHEVKNALVIGEACEQIYRSVKKGAEDGKFVLTIGGDHSLGCPTICGVMAARPDLCVVWVDAHGDCNTPETSPSKNYHGMPAAHALGWFRKKVAGFEWMDEHLESPLSKSRIAFIALRDVDAGEKQLLKSHGVKVFTMMDIDKYGISVVMERALQSIDPSHSRPIHLSFDIDAIDPAVAPGTGTKAKGGLTYRESHYICESLAATQRLGSMDMVEINPEMDRRILAAKCGSPSQDSPRIDVEPMHGDNPKISGTPTVKLGIELIESALGRTVM